jgi:uncharacterized membrane protein YfcA
VTVCFFVLTVGLIAGALSGIIGTGSSIMALPILEDARTQAGD